MEAHLRSLPISQTLDPRGMCLAEPYAKGETTMSTTAWIVVLLLVFLLIGGGGYFYRR